MSNHSKIVHLHGEKMSFSLTLSAISSHLEQLVKGFSVVAILDRSHKELSHPWPKRRSGFRFHK